MTNDVSARGSQPAGVRLSLTTKLTAAFVFVSLIGFVLAFWLLPRLYVLSKNREIELSKPQNVELLKSSFGAWIRFSESDLLDRAQSAAGVLAECEQLDFRGLDLSGPTAAREVLARLKESGKSTQDLEVTLGVLEEIFSTILFLPQALPPIEDRMILARDEETGRLYWPLYFSFSLPDRGFEGTLVLAMGGLNRDPLDFDPKEFIDEVFPVLKNLGLAMISEIVFISEEDLHAVPGLKLDFDSHLDDSYWEETVNQGAKNQRRLYVPVRNLQRNEEIVGLFSLLYEPTASLPVWRDLAGGPAYVALAVAALVAVLFSIFFAKNITRPVQELTQGALSIAEGDLDRRVPVSTGDEIGVLADTFNQMTQRLRRTLDQLRERAETIEQQNLELDRRFNELRTLQNYTENILKTVDSAIFSVDLDGNIRRPNRAACDLLGIADGQSSEDLESDALRDRLAAALEMGESTVSDEIQVVSPSGDRIPVAVSVSPLREGDAIGGSVAVLTDLQVIKNLEALVSRQERLAALGQLTAGVAHEVRNPLSIIKACAEILQQKFGGLPEENGLCRDILEETNRLSRVVTDFLSFARPAEPSFGLLDLNDALNQILDRVEREGVLGSRVVRRFSDQEILIEADCDQVEQVALNLIRNADEAMKGVGTVTVRTGRDLEGEKVWFEVQDDGAGMDPETLNKIFNPFFTSKAEGTGLGLSICYRVMEAHRGSIEVVETAPGSGALFRVTFPRSAEHAIKPLQRETLRS